MRRRRAIWFLVLLAVSNVVFAVVGFSWQEPTRILTCSVDGCRYVSGSTLRPGLAGAWVLWDLVLVLGYLALRLTGATNGTSVSPGAVAAEGVQTKGARKGRAFLKVVVAVNVVPGLLIVLLLASGCDTAFAADICPQTVYAAFALIAVLIADAVLAVVALAKRTVFRDLRSGPIVPPDKTGQL